MFEKRKLDNIVIVGGGTAGWFTALYCLKNLPESNITLVESEEIGILGAGESTTPHFVGALKYLDLNIEDLVKYTNSTFKNAIKFTNWNGDGQYYYNPFFSSMENISGQSTKFENESPDISLYFNINASNNKSSQSFDYPQVLCNKNKSSFKISPNSNNLNFLSDLDVTSSYAMQFDAREIAKFLRTEAENKGIIRIEGKVKNIICDRDEQIKQLILENEKIIDCDFVFDCTGFAKLFIGKKFKSEWVSYSKYLPVKSALPFFIETDYEEDIPPYTECIAMKYGWMWKIPLQHRYGCGYVYDSDLISEQDAVIEIEEFLGYKPDYPRKDKGSFSFEAGCYKKTWINNCIAIGLSSGFIEPLESTSIWGQLSSLHYIFSNIHLMYYKDNNFYNEYNDYVYKINESIMEFIYLHYMSERSDSDFWTKFKDISKAPQRVQNTLELWKYSIPSKDNIPKSTVFPLQAWLDVAYGTKNINIDLLKDNTLLMDLNKKYIDRINLMSIKQIDLSNSCISHKEVLQYLGGTIN